MARSNANFSTVEHVQRFGQAIPAPNIRTWLVQLDNRNNPGGPDRARWSSLSAPGKLRRKYFRNLHFRTWDTDGDGVNDWEEYKLGLDPLMPLATNQLGANGQPLKRLRLRFEQTASQNVIRISATDPTATNPTRRSPAPSTWGRFVGDSVVAFR